MRSPRGGSGRWLAGVFAGCVAVFVGLLLWVGIPGVFGGSGGSPIAQASVGRQAPAPGLDLDSIMVPGVQPLDEGQQALDSQQARHTSSAAYVTRLRSRTEFEHLGAARATQVAREAFPRAIDTRDGGTPALPSGDRLLRYSSPHIAQLSIPGHARAVIESLGSMARPSASGGFEPIDLALNENGSSFAPASPEVGIRIAKHLDDGVQASASGVSLTPVDAGGGALHGAEGSLQGASVVYANTQADTDTIAKPTISGFELSSILRSENSPNELYYRVGLPSGASLVQHQGHGPVQVVSDGATLGLVEPPAAVDASGMSVPVTMGVRGDLLSVSVQDTSNEYQYPMEVDPEYIEVRDRSLTGGVFPVEKPKEGETNWIPYHSAGLTEEHTYTKNYSCGANREWCEQLWYIEPNREYNASEWAGLQYKTKGQSTVYNVELWVTGYNEPSQTTTKVEYNYGPKGEYQDNHFSLSEGVGQSWYEYKPLAMTSGYFHNPLETPRENDFRIVDYTNKHESLYGFFMQVNQAQVYVAQEETKHPVTEFNTSSSTIAEAENRPNVLYGGGSWLGPNSGAYEVTAHDPGIGVSFMAISGAGMSQERFIREKEGLCQGIQCPETQHGPATYLPTMANGNDSIEVFAEDAAGLEGYTTETIKVDAERPYNLGFTGMPEVGAEISAGPHTLTLHATDGKSPTPSSGVKTIGVSIDGSAITSLPSSSCPEGECTAHGEYTLHAEGLTEGVHRLIVTATDNAGNEASKQYLFDVRHASPVSVGPGAVDPTTGQFTLHSQDVSLGGSAGVSRTYQSRNLTAGIESPFGSQWTMSVGGGEKLTVLATGSVVLEASNGGQTTFSLNEKGEYESPKGDENLKITYKASEHKYVLADSRAGSETVFEQPSGTESTRPAYVNQFGSGETQMKSPTGVTVDPSGNVWVADTLEDRILKFSKSGELLAAYGSYGSGEGQFLNPREVVINPSTKNVYVLDETNNRVVELNEKGEFIETFGWGVTNGAKEFETCKSGTYYCQAGIAGSGEGQFKEAKGMAIDSSGNLWVVDEGNNRIEEFGANGEYKQGFGKEGTGEAQFKTPVGIAIYGGNLYVAEYGNDRVQELSTAGKYIAQFGKAGSGKEELSYPRGITVDSRTGNLYIADTGNNRVQEFTSAGKFVTNFGSAGSEEGQFTEPKGVAVGASGELYVTDQQNNRVEEWGRSTWWPTSAKGALSTGTTYTYESVENAEGKTSIQPYEVLPATPAGVTCGTKIAELKQGCRALTFEYSKTTSASGEAPTAWGAYKGYLNRVFFHGYNPAKGFEKMEEKIVAQYSYDNQGRLRAEWDPRIEASTACGSTCSKLQTTYGYDPQGRVTATTQSGQQGWEFTYGPIANDPSTGRLLKVTRAHPKAGESEEQVKEKLNEEKEAPKNSETPKLSTSKPIVGESLSVTNGTWTNSPLAYGYQWLSCSYEQSGENELLRCTQIVGAVNSSYTPLAHDRGHRLCAEVTATNGGGSVSKSPRNTCVLGMTEPVAGSSELETEPVPPPPSTGTNAVTTLEYHLLVSGTGLPTLTKEVVEQWGQKDISESEDNDPVEGMAIFPPDEPQGWPASKYTRATIDYLNAKGLSVNTALPTGGISTTEYNALNQVTRTLSPDNRVTAMKEECSKTECKSAKLAEKLDTKTEYAAEGGEMSRVTGPEHQVKLRSGSEVQARSLTQYYYDKGAKEVEEKTHETYALVTRTTSGALLENGKEEDKRETVDSYGGQKNLGWKLREPTSVTTGSGTSSLTTTTVYSESTGQVVETRSPVGSGGGSFVAPPYGFASGILGSGNGQFKEPRGVAIDASNNVWVVDSENNRLEKLSPSGSYLAAYGSSGSGAGQFSGATGIAINRSSGNAYVSDRLNMRVEEFSAAGSFVRTFGFGVTDGLEKPEVCTSSCRKGNVGSGGGQFRTPDGIAIDAAGNVWVADSGNNRIEEFSSEGAFIAAYGSLGSGNGQFQSPESVAYDDGLLYVTDTGNNRIEEFSTSGEYRGQFGSSGIGSGQFSSPSFIAADPVSGSLYVLDVGNSRVQEFTLSGGFLGAFGSKGTGGAQFGGTEAFSPDGIAVNVAGDVYAADTPDNRVETWISVPGRMGYTSQFGSLGSGNGQFHLPVGVALDASGNQWVTDYYNNRIEKLSSTGTYLAEYGGYGTGVGQMIEPVGIAINKSSGYVYISDQANNRVEEFNPSGGFVSVWGFGVSNGEEKFQVCKVSCRAGVSGSGSGQFNRPGGVTIDSAGNVWVVDESNHRLEEFSSAGSFTAAVGWGVKDGKAEAEVCTTTCQAGISGSGNGQLNKPAYIAASDGNIYVTDYNNNRVERFSTAGAYVAQFGTVGSGNGQFKGPAGITADAFGDLFIVDDENDRVEELTRIGTYVTSFGTKGTGNGQLNEPEGIAVDSTGTLHVVDSLNNRIETFTPPSRPGNEGAHDTKTIYYSAEGESPLAECQNHPDWADLTCQVEPVAQPGDEPNVPVTRMTYNIWDEIETTTENFAATAKLPATARTKAQTYDSAGRALTSEETASPVTDTALPTVTNEYNKETGALEKQNATIKGKTKTITSKANTLGQLAEYVDAEGNVAKYTYEASGDDRLDEVSEGKGAESASYQTYSYNATTGLMEKLVDSAAKTFTAVYDVEGKMTSEVYPNGMCADTTYNATGEAVGLEYIKTRNCSEKSAPVWFSNSIVPSIHGETLQQTSTLSKENYAYDEDGRLTKTEETPSGKGCKTRLYGYDEESNRTSETTRESSTETCAPEGGTVEAHSYDSANRLLDSGVEYDTFGNVTKLPAGDAGGYALASKYYVDGQVESQKQGEENESHKLNERAIAYTYDPVGRVMETITENTEPKTKSTVISHYAGAGSALTWTSEGSEKWTRNIPGIDGTLDAIQKGGGATVLQLHDLKGDIVGEASISEAEVKLLSTYNSTEFGVPTTSTPPRYSWLGANSIASELSSGVSTEGGASYVPQVAKDLQTAPVVPPGAFPNGFVTGQAYKATVSAAELAVTQAEATKSTQEAEAARQKAKEKEEKETLERCRAAGGCGAEVAPTPSDEELTAEEWRESYDEWEGSWGTTAHAAFLGEGIFKEAVKAIASGATSVARTLYSWTWYYWPTEVESQRLGWEFWVELTKPEGAGLLALNCYKESAEYGNAVAINPIFGGLEDPLEDIRVTAAMVTGCLKNSIPLHNR